MRGRKTFLFIILGLIVAALIGGGLWFILGNGEVSIPNKPQTEQTTNNIPTIPKEEEKIDSHLFRDNIIGQTKDVVNQTETIEESILGYNWETNYIYNSKNVLIGFISTIVPPKDTEFDYARTHQLVSGAISDDTGAEATSEALWNDGNIYEYSPVMWNKGLSNGSLRLQDAFSTHQGKLLLVSSGTPIDGSLSRPASEKAFITLLVGSKEFIDMYGNK